MRASDITPIGAELDHIVVPVEDLELASAAFETLGFIVSPKSQHPFGTANRLIVLDGNFIELLSVEQPEKLGSYQVVADFIRRFGGGPWCLVWRPQDILEAFRLATHLSLKPSALQDRIKRGVDLPNGLTGMVEYSSFATTANHSARYLEGYSVQHRPESLFVSEWMSHPNCAMSIAETEVLTANLDRETDRLKDLFGASVQRSAGDVSVVFARGKVRFHESCPTEGGSTEPRIGAVTIRTGDLERTKRYVRAAGLPFSEEPDGSVQIWASGDLPIELKFIGNGAE